MRYCTVDGFQARALIITLEDGIVRTRSRHRAAAYLAAQKIGLDSVPLQHYFGRVDRGEEKESTEFPELFTRVWSKNRHAMDHYLLLYEQERDGIPLEVVEGAAQWIATLHRLGVTLVLISSNQPDKVSAMLEVAGVDAQCFTYCYTNDGVLPIKPDARVLQHIAEHLGCLTSELAYVGSSYPDYLTVSGRTRFIGVGLDGFTAHTLRRKHIRYFEELSDIEVV